MSKLWVKFEGNNATRVSTEGCEIIDDFIEAVTKKLTRHIDCDQISISLTAGGKALRGGLKLNEIPNISENNDENPLFIRSTSSGIEV
jgi:hypothetical protein